MFCERTKGGAAQTTAGEFQEETKNREATVRAKQKEQMFTGTKTKMEAALTVSMSNKIFCFLLQVLK